LSRPSTSFEQHFKTGMPATSAGMTIQSIHIGGVTPSRPIRQARPCSVPSACLPFLPDASLRSRYRILRGAWRRHCEKQRDEAIEFLWFCSGVLR
jgi:hypothetical protein